ncbi:LiaI-LiaF-like domain-containing protein [Oceanobacillus kapialis]|uniref:LiaI-LiaF-like domain-containing protein n=1 Tax=Oceanobacillus kapialis TaxID=481353 RepID=A0ABW5PZC3_9BACI
MKKQHALPAYILIGIGIFFLLRQLKLPIITDFYSWQTIIIIIGLALLIHSYTSKSYQNLFSGTLLLGLGIHLHGVQHYHFWIDHWAVYLLIIGIAFLVRRTKVKQGLLPGVFFTAIAILLIFSVSLPPWLDWIYSIINLLEQFWPVALILIGIYMLMRKK